MKRQHSIVVCSRCRVATGARSKPGTRLASVLRAGLEADLATDFHVGEADCMAACSRPLTVAFSASGKASYLFGDIDPTRDAPDLPAFARLYRSLADGWSKESERPAGLAGKTLARIPHSLGRGVSDE